MMKTFPMYVITDACYITIQTFYRRLSKTIEAEEEAVANGKPENSMISLMC
jgi:hypothetical protein